MTVIKEESRNLSIREALDYGVGFAERGKYANAEALFRGVLIHEPQNFEAFERLGSVLFEQRQFYEALYWFWRGIKVARRQPLALTNYGLTLAQLGHADEGLPYLQRAAAICEQGASEPVKALVWNNLGNTLERLGKFKEALPALDKGIKYDPVGPFPRYNRGIVLIRLGRYEEAVTSLNEALKFHHQQPIPNNHEIADVHYNRGMALLTLGDLKNGFADYEYRLQTSENQDHNFGFPPEKKWNGEELGDTPLLIIGEQGLGDNIQFLRFLPEALKRAPNLTLAVHSAVAPMVREQWPNVPLLPAKTEIPHDQIGRWCAMMSLPHALGIERESDLPMPWFPALDPARVNALLSEGNHGGLRVGVCWAGNFNHKNDHNRSIPLDLLHRLFETGCQFVSIQQLRPGEEAPFSKLKETYGIETHDLTDMRDTAAIIAGCDLVISADSAMAHLSGSIGRPTWVLIPAQNTDWRWQLHRKDSPWYPSMRLWRQERGKGWGPVIDAMADWLRALRQEEAA